LNAWCCDIDCKKMARWRAEWLDEKAPDCGSVDACSEHLGSLLPIDCEARVVSLTPSVVDQLAEVGEDETS
jgi:hypothetical protein